MKKVLSKIKLFKFKQNWRKQNLSNYTTVSSYFDVNKVSVSKRTYGTLNIRTYGNSSEKLSIGSYCSIAGNVWFLLGGEHNYDGLLTYPFDNYVLNIQENTISKGPIVIKDDVWIGEGCTILSGVTIGQGSVIGAGTVVAKDVPPYSIFVNGKVIKYRFNEALISKLIKLDLSKLDEDYLSKNKNLIYRKLDEDIFSSVEHLLIK